MGSYRSSRRIECTDLLNLARSGKFYGLLSVETKQASHRGTPRESQKHKAISENNALTLPAFSGDEIAKLRPLVFSQGTNEGKHPQR